MSNKIGIAVFNAVLHAGALTTRRLIKAHGPKPLWERLVTLGYLKMYRTTYGSVIALGTSGRELVRSASPEVHVPYVAGPSAVADRAFQNDALTVLESRGYQLHHHEYKRVGTVGRAARNGLAHTDQILRSVVQLPDDQMQRLESIYKPRLPYLPDSVGLYPPYVGRPTLYASISSGGIKLPKLRELHKKHENQINYSWHCPLLIAVPQEGDLRAFIRALEARRLQKAKRDLRAHETRDFHDHPLIELIVLPVP